jgi:NAD(P)H-nitrite reductase large subunit
MVGLHLLERLTENKETAKSYRIITYVEEEELAYDRVRLTTYIDHEDASKLSLASKEWSVI